MNFSDVWLPGKDEFNRQHAVWGHTADQLRAYGEAVRAEERAAILDIAMRRSLLSDNLDQLRGYECCKEGIIASIKERADAIRSSAPPQCTAPPSEPQ